MFIYTPHLQTQEPDDYKYHPCLANVCASHTTLLILRFHLSICFFEVFASALYLIIHIVMHIRAGATTLRNHRLRRTLASSEPHRASFHNHQAPTAPV